jgi:hypothetical protein
MLGQGQGARGDSAGREQRVGAIGLAERGLSCYNPPLSGTTGQLVETVYHFRQTRRKPHFFA